MRDLVRFMYDNTVSITGEYTNWAAHQGAREKAKEGGSMKMYECTKTFEIKPPAYSGCGSMLVHKGTLWYAVESGRERTTLTDSRIKLVLSDRLFKSHFVRWG